ncbi:1,4-dihydroxy-2-naphthoate polyprenyltransferase [Amnibacterium setariae]|uniref:1,4-dihydroxy-2-naphthoate octaprenyltransferase n=1 Tax=Amnibacterium setariae TaxID=2306585 RepID=A0A3A1TZE5_9MICO|nr:1,4-dihydroxy-2-naphthoate polyprenyltransferase [Amnibacterium setariae]
MPLAVWVSGARPRTLTLSVVPVVLGTAAAALDGRVVPGLALLALGTALLLQVGVNYANDYSDGVRGTDRFRVGPARLTGSGAARPHRVRAVAIASLTAAAVCGAALAVASGLWWLLAVGALALAAAWLYTGGPRPYGYAGFGDVAVFVFFGLVGTLGTELVQAGRVSLDGVLVAAAAGCFACAVLMINNIRDVGPDSRSGKRTLAVRLGLRRARTAYAVLLVLPYAVAAALVPAHPGALLALLSLPLSASALAIGVRAVPAPALVTALKRTSAGALVFAVALAVGLVLG